MKKKIIVFLILLLVLAGSVTGYLLYRETSVTLDNGENFSAYSQFRKEADDTFYIRQISVEDITDGPAKDIRLTHNSLVLIAKTGTSYEEIEALAQSVQGTVCGYNQAIDLYQLNSGCTHPGSYHRSRLH